MLSRIRRAFRRMGGPLVIVVWQAAPVATVQDGSGRTRVSLGWGRARHLERIYDYADGCYGGDRELVEEYPVDRNVAGVQVEHWSSPTARVTGWVSKASADGAAVGGWAGGIAGGWQMPAFGIDVGLALSPLVLRQSPGDSLGRVLPSISLRAGNLDGLHVQADFMPSGPAALLTGYTRIGVGVNRGLNPGFSAFVGTAACIYCDLAEEDPTSLFAEFSVPLGDRFDLLAWGLSGTVETRAFGAGLRPILSG